MTKVTKEFYVDNTAPSGNISLNLNANYINATVNASDEHSGVKNYGYLLQKDNATCPETGYTTSTNNTYVLMATDEGEYTVCAKVTDNAGNSTYINKSINLAFQSITYKDVGDTEFSGIHESGYPVVYEVGGTTVLDIPSRSGYTFNGYYLSSDGTGDRVFKILVTQEEDVTLYAKWIDDKPYGVANLSLNNGVFTLTLSNYGDDGSGLTGTYGYSLISSGTCEGATYETSTELSKTYNGTYTEGTTYYGCIKLADNSGNIAYLKSAEITYKDSVVLNTYSSYGQYTFNVLNSGIYKIELWGAQGGDTTSNNLTKYGGKGGYVKGNIFLIKDEKLYFYVGENYNGAKSDLSFNGGGSGQVETSTTGYNSNGGGATDVRLISGDWSNSTSLSSRIMVAGGGGGSQIADAGTYANDGGYAGGLIGGNGFVTQAGSTALSPANGGTQVYGGVQYSNGGVNGKFGIGGYDTTYSYSWVYASGGGGGYYGGASGGALTAVVGSASGGSSYISGHTGCVAINSSSNLTPKSGCTTGSTDNACSIHYSNKKFTDTVMIDGGGYSWSNVKGNLQAMPNPREGGNYASGTGHSGSGMAKITFVSSNTLVLTYNNNGGSGCNAKSIISGSKYGKLCTSTRDGYKFLGWYTSITGGNKITSETIVNVTGNQTIYARWEESTNPTITFSLDGNGNYQNGDISTIINVNKGSNLLNIESFKYIYSQNIEDTPNIEFTSGNSYNLTGATGTYYLIAEACDILSNCVREVSKAFYVDNTSPTGNVTLSFDNMFINAKVNAQDMDSGIDYYGYSIYNGEIVSCPESGYTILSNSEYNFSVFSKELYTICTMITDKAGNTSYIKETIEPSIVNINFTNYDSNFDYSSYVASPYTGTVSWSGSGEHIATISGNVGQWGPYIGNFKQHFTDGAYYRISFDMKTNVDKTVRTRIEYMGEEKAYNSTTTYQTYTYDFKYTYVDSPSAGLAFNFYNTYFLDGEQLYIKNLTITQLAPSNELVNLATPTRSGYKFIGWKVTSGDGKSFTNLIKNGDFESNTNGWSISGVGNVAINSTYKVFGNKSINVSGSNSNTYVDYHDIKTPINHVIYSSVYTYKVTSESSNGYLLFEHWKGDLSTKHDEQNASMAEITTPNDANQWGRYSKRFISVYDTTMTRLGNYSTNETNSYNYYYDGVLLIDLTETFGQGNEPTKEWMDTNIDYFNNSALLTGTQNVVLEAQWEKTIYNYSEIAANYSCANSSAGSSPIFTYTGNCQLLDDGSGNWRIKFLSSGTFTTIMSNTVDIFAVGGGAGGAGGGGYASTLRNVSLGTTGYYLTIGAGGGNGGAGGATSFGSLVSAGGGNPNGGAGGNNGGRHGSSTCGNYPTCSWYSCTDPGDGGSYGGGATCEFGEGSSSGCNRGDGYAYSGGGGGCGNVCGAGAGSAGRGLSGDNSGHGGTCTGAGSSGVIVIRNAR